MIVAYDALVISHASILFPCLGRLTALKHWYSRLVRGLHGGRNQVRKPLFWEWLIGRIKDVALTIIIPLFFVFTGLRTQIGLLNEVYLWQVAGWLILIAIVGKFLGSALAARYVGQRWHSSLSIGALTNARGLMKLVVLNIGYDLGILTVQVFPMTVIMALATTLMTGPALNAIDWFFTRRRYAVTE